MITIINTIKYPVKAARKFLSPLPPKRFKIFSDYANFLDNDANELLKNELLEDKPLLICKFGTTELATIHNYLSINEKKNFKDIFRYIKREKNFLWWWDSHVQLSNLSGVFPTTTKMAKKFSELMLEDIKEIDILCSYIEREIVLKDHLSHTKKINIDAYLFPFRFEHPWTQSLAGKKVLVVHPFEESIQNQYKKRHLLYKNQNVLPEFELSTIKAVQSIANNSSPFKNWFEALDHMKNQIGNSDFDIALIGCGAYGLPLAAHVKRMGKKGIHLAGWTQILFGIYGKRWEKDEKYSNIINEHWVRPLDTEVPVNYKKVEGGAYW